MTSRRFSGSQRAALYLAADGKCTECGVELGPGWHADHVDPWSLGGTTDVVNGQALCPDCNLRKGASVSGLRKWQANALQEFAAWIPQGDDGFLVEATPGAGKTRFAVEVARQLMHAGRIAQVVIAVPTRRLETQWAEAFSAHGIDINPAWQAADGRLASDEHGCAATYGEIGFSPQSFRYLISQKPTLAILDEVHHCGEERSWGEAVRLAFSPAVVKVLLSGTPFRSDNNAIPFVRYVDNQGAPDFRYGYDMAMTDRVVRAVFFPRRGGLMEWDDPRGDRRKATFDDALDERDAKHRLRTAVSPTGDWLPSVLADADKQLAELRELDPMAAGIVFCEDSTGARAAADMLTRLGRSPVLAISEEPESDERIRAFRASRDRWIVSIRKVSEGVDIPRLRVGVYATPWVTELFFRQVVGRLVRTMPEEDDPTAHLFIPDDERLRSMAAEIKKQRDHVLNEQDAELLDNEGLEERPTSLFMPIASTATDEGVIFGEDLVTPDELAQAERIKRLDASTAALPTPQLAIFLRNAGLPTAPPGQLFAVEADEPSLYDRKAKLKRANNALAARIAQALGVEHRKVNGWLNRHIGVHKITQASEQQLEKRLDLAKQWLESGEIPDVES